MLKSLGLLTAVALLASPVAFGQNSADSQTPAAPAATGDTSSPASTPQASAPNAAPESGTSTTMAMREHHRHHAKGSSTDNLADRLNACQAGANPTPEQEQCLRGASGEGAQPQ